jgi:hypothetical protein
MGPLVGLLAAGILLPLLFRKRKVITPVGEVQVTIAEEAKRQGLDPAVALLFADLETGFKNVTGDKNWPAKIRSDGRTNWETFVRDNPRYDDNPFRGDAALWLSYGPFQLLAPHHLYKVNPDADPRILTQLPVNTKIGVQLVKKLYDQYNGDLAKMRIAFVCGGLSSCPERASSVVARLRSRAEKYGLAA